MSLGWSQDQLEDAARMVFAQSPKGMADPRYREQATRTAKDMQANTELQKLQKRTEELEGQLNAQREQQYVETYLENVAMAVNEEATPLVNSMIERNPESTMEKLHQMADYLYRETGEVPDADDVVAEYEKARRTELEELGLDVSSIGKRRKKSKNKTHNAGEKKTARTLTNKLNKPTKSQPEPETEDELDAQIVAELEAMSKDG